MLAQNQSNGKKSSNSSIVNTPIGTPINTNGNNSHSSANNSAPLNNNAPKYGTLVPNRIFVGGISANTTEGELLQLFSTYGTVKAANIIQDRAGVSKGYGFITFESEDDAKRPLREADNIVLRERKLNIAPAVKKQPFNRSFDGSSPPTLTMGNATQYFLPPGAVPYFQSSVGFFPPPNGPQHAEHNSQTPQCYQAPPMYSTQSGPHSSGYHSVMLPTQTIYMPQQYPVPIAYECNYYSSSGTHPQFIIGTQSGPCSQGQAMSTSENSPRSSCFNHQISYSQEPVFYNMPMFGSQVDHMPLFGDGLDAVNPYGEDIYNTQSSEKFDHLHLKEHRSFHYGQQGQKTSHNVDNDSRAYSSMGSIEHSVAPTRQSNTPVVSLLSIDSSQERDYYSMQGGRRNKSNVYNIQSPLSQHQRGHICRPQNQANRYIAPSFSQNSSAPSHISSSLPRPSPVPLIDVPNRHYHHCSHHNISNNLPGSPYLLQSDSKLVSNGGPPPPSFPNKPCHNQNSDRHQYNNATNNYYQEGINKDSFFDENRNEERFRTRTSTPPPAPYSPLNNHTYAFRYGSSKLASNNIQNAQGGAPKKYQPSLGLHVVKSESENKMATTQDHQVGQAHSVSYDSNLQQVHGCTITQSFIPAQRRNRRTLRRHIAAAPALNEIGAGDAPLPGALDVSDVCKKLESLKM